MEKIALVVAAYPSEKSGGIVTSMQFLANSLVNRGYDLKVFTYNDLKNTAESYPAFKSEISVIRISIQDSIKKTIKKFCSLVFSILDGRKHAYQLSDILICQLGAFRMFKYLRRYSPDIIIAADQGAPLLFYKKNKKEKIILTSHHNPIRFIEGIYRNINSERDAQISLYLENKYIKLVDAVITPSKYMSETFRNTHNNYKGEVATIPNILNLDLIKSIKPKKFQNGVGPKIYVPSGYSPYKGGLYLVKILKEVHSLYQDSIYYYISGDVDKILFNELKSINGVNIFSPGSVSFEDNISYVKSCDFCLSPTSLESYGMAITEALSCGLPSVYWNALGNTGLPTRKYQSRILDIADCKSTAKAIVSMIKKRKKKLKTTAHIQRYNAINIMNYISVINSIA